MVFLQKEIAPQIAKGLVRFGLVTRDNSPQNIAFITKLLVDFSRAGFGAVLKGLLHGAEEEKDGPGIN
jgi:hypothetical protein